MTVGIYRKHELFDSEIQMRRMDHLHQPAGLLISVEIELLINQEAETNQNHDKHTLTHKDRIPACILPHLIM